MDTHALSRPALETALEVFAANGVTAMVQEGLGYTPTPVISHAILTHNRQAKGADRADGVVVTPSHNPPSDGGFKYNPPEGCPADTATTKAIEDRANEILRQKLAPVRRMGFASRTQGRHHEPLRLRAPQCWTTWRHPGHEAQRRGRAQDRGRPAWSSGIGFLAPIAERWGLNLTGSTPGGPDLSFMTVDKDGKIRMDCSSPYAMRPLIAHKDGFDEASATTRTSTATASSTRSHGLMNPNHYLAVAVDYLFRNRPGWRPTPRGQDRGHQLHGRPRGREPGRKLSEVPVGFKWFVEGLIDGSYGFGGEESAGSSFLRKDGSVWTTTRTASSWACSPRRSPPATGRDPARPTPNLPARPRRPAVRAPGRPGHARAEGRLQAPHPEHGRGRHPLAGDPITARLTHAPGNGADIGGLKVCGAKRLVRRAASARITSTRSTPKAFWAANTWSASRPRPRPWSMQPFRAAGA
jgi:phosphoglucomutase